MYLAVLVFFAGTKKPLACG